MPGAFDSLILAAALSMCLAAVGWFALIGARAARHALLRRSRRSRESAARALLRYRADRDGDALAAVLRAMKPDVLAAFLGSALPLLDEADGVAVCAILRRDGFDRRIAAAFPAADDSLRLLYCELLAATGGEAAVPVLEKALAGGTPAVRIAAALALAELGAAPEMDILLARLGPEARASARIALLFELLLPECEMAIVRIAADGGAEPRLRLSALESLRLGGRRVHQRLLAALAGDVQPPVAAEVARSLAFAPEPSPAALGLLAHPAPDVRRAAARSAGRLGGPAFDPALRRLLADRDPTVASLAARSLWMLRGDPALPASAPAPRRLACHD
jgi:HEAT repeat protein